MNSAANDYGKTSEEKLAEAKKRLNELELAADESAKELANSKELERFKSRLSLQEKGAVAIAGLVTLALSSTGGFGLVDTLKTDDPTPPSSCPSDKIIAFEQLRADGLVSSNDFERLRKDVILDELDDIRCE